MVNLLSPVSRQFPHFPFSAVIGRSKLPGFAARAKTHSPRPHRRLVTSSVTHRPAHLRQMQAPTGHIPSTTSQFLLPVVVPHPPQSPTLDMYVTVQLQIADAASPLTVSPSESPRPLLQRAAATSPLSQTRVLHVRPQLPIPSTP